MACLLPQLLTQALDFRCFLELYWVKGEATVAADRHGFNVLFHIRVRTFVKRSTARPSLTNSRNHLTTVPTIRPIYSTTQADRCHCIYICIYYIIYEYSNTASAVLSALLLLFYTSTAYGMQVAVPAGNCKCKAPQPCQVYQKIS